MTKTSQKVEEKGKELENMREKYAEIRELVHKVPVGCHAFQIERAPQCPALWMKMAHHWQVSEPWG